MSETEKNSAEDHGAIETPATPATPVVQPVEAAPDPAEAAREEEILRSNEDVKRQMRRRTRRSFLLGGASMLAGIGGFRWITRERQEGGVAWPLRQVLEINEGIARDYYSPKRLSPTFKPADVHVDRVNGHLGLHQHLDFSTWELTVEGLASSEGSASLTLDAIKHLPRVEMVTQLRCIEGWSVVVGWAGARFTDFMAAYPPATQSGDPLDLKNGLDDLPPYVGMETPDDGYYVGLDVESMLNPQTLLCYEMNGSPLTSDHGAPLRLVMPHKYGVKNIKRIGRIRYGLDRPPDYWAEQGYDWYLGL